VKNSKQVTKSILHSKNKHREEYDFDKLIKNHPLLSSFVEKNKYGTLSIDFHNPEAVKSLNIALLKTFYKLTYWDFPKGYLCPPIPGRVDYIHYLADLLSETKSSKRIKCLDIGTGANCIYPILGVTEYQWSFVASDIDTISLESAQKIASNNSILRDKIEFRHQENPKHIFQGIINKGDFFNVSICNPPFHKSKKMAESGTHRKLRNLNNTDSYLPNFEGQNNELWCKGGEKMFIKNMIKESSKFSKSVRWFTTLVSKQDHLNSFYDALKKVNATDVRTINMAQGNKKSRILAWTFA